MYPNAQQGNVSYIQPLPNVNVVTVQPQLVARREWTHGLFSCCDDCSELLCAYFCCPCYAYQLSQRADESCWGCFFVGFLPYRTKIRTERKIDGSIIGDCCALYWCPFCSLIQMSKEARDTRPLI